MGNEVLYSLGEEILDYYIDKSDSYFSETTYYLNEEEYMVNMCEELASLCILSYRLAQWNEKRKKQYMMYSVKYIEILIMYLDKCKSNKVQQYGYTALGYCLDILSDEKQSLKGFNIAVNEAVINLTEILLDKKNRDISDEEVIGIITLAGYLNERKNHERAKEVSIRAFKKISNIYEKRRHKLSLNTLLYIIHALLTNCEGRITRLMHYYMVMDFKELAILPLNHEETITKINIECSLFGIGEKNTTFSYNAEKTKHKNQILNKWMDLEIAYNEMLVFITERLDGENILYKLKGIV